MMKHGKKATSQRIFNDSIVEIKKLELERVRGDAEKARGKAEEDGTLLHVSQEQVDPSAFPQRPSLC
jgi:hypothetical protein